MQRGGFLRLPERNEILDFAEGARGQDAETQKKILHLLVSSQIMRQQVADLKRDLYIIDVQVPDYSISKELGAQMAQLTQAWVKLQYSRKFSFKNFYRTNEFFSLMVFVAAALIGLIILIGVKY